MCLIRVRGEEVDDTPPPRRVTTVITPIPAAPPLPPPAEPVYSTALVPSNLAYDMNSRTIVEARYAPSTASYQNTGHGYAAESEYMYANSKVHRRSSRRSRYSRASSSTGTTSSDDERDAARTRKTTIIKGSITGGSSVSRSQSAARVAKGIDPKADVILGPNGDPYVKAHRHRHRRRSGSIEREKSTTHYVAAEGGNRRHSHVSVSGGRSSHISISNGRSEYGGTMASDPNRSSFRYIEPRNSVGGGMLESPEMVRRREAERFAYGGVADHRRSGSISYVNSDPGSPGGHRRSFSGGGGRRSRDKVVMMDREYY